MSIMEASELIEIINRGEDSAHQFKSNITNPESIAAEMVAFSNTKGGMLIIGVDDNGSLIGVPDGEVGRINQLLANTATNSVKNPINPFTENIVVEGKRIIVVHIPEGIDKPYFDNNGVVWLKSGSDKRRVTSREELRRLYQSSDLVHADEIPVNGASMENLDLKFFRDFYRLEYDENVDDADIEIRQLMNNLNLAKGNILNIAGLLLFSQKPEIYKPAFIVKAISFVGNDPGGLEYRDSEDISGKLPEQYKKTLSFITRNLRKIQNGQGINSPGILEIPKIVLEELLVNALIHRDYFINAPIRVFIFDNRLEIISPGILPNNLTIENIKSGVSVIRNDILASFATKILPYRGIGTGVRRALKSYPEIQLVNDTENNQFKVIVTRK